MKFCKMCGSELPDEAVFCTNCGAACDDETESTTVLDEELVETALSSTDVEETTVLSQDETGETGDLEESIEETTVLEMNRDRDEDKDTTVLSPSEKEKEAITTVIPNENGFDEAVNGIVSDVKNHKKGIIVAIIAFILIVVVAISIAIVNSNHSDEIDTEQSTTNTENTKQETSGISKDGRIVSIISVTGNGITSDDAKVYYDGYDNGIEYPVEGLCIYGTLKYDHDIDMSDYDGQGGNIFDENYNEVIDNLSEKANQIDENDYDSEYCFTQWADPKKKEFLVGLPDDINPGTYIIDCSQWLKNNDTPLYMEIMIKVE